MAKEEGITFVLKVRDDGTAVIEKASGSFGKLGTEAKKAKSGVDPLTSSVKSLGMEMIAFAGAYLAVNQITNFAKATFEAGRSIQATQKAFVEITGSTRGMQNEFKFLQELADKTGQNFYDLTGVYKGFLAASKGTNLEGEQTQRIFQSIVKASSTLGLTSENTRGALYAVQQMMSKGVVSSEELRQQLGERLPGAYNLLAEAMGVSVAQLQKMLAEGKVLSDEALPKLADVLEKRYSGVMASSTEAVNKLNESWERFKISISDSGFADIAVAGMNALTTAFKFWGERASLRSISETYREGLELAKQGLIDLDSFAKASFMERQKIVDSIFAHEQKLLAGKSIAPKKSASTPIKSGPLPSSEMETALKKIVEENRKAQVEIDSLNSSAYEKALIRIESEYQAKKKVVGSSVELEKWKNNQINIFGAEQAKAAHESDLEALEIAAKSREDYLKIYLDSVEKAEKAEQEKSEMLGQLALVDQKIVEESNKDKADAYRQMYDDIGKTTKESHAFKTEALKKEYSILKQVLGDSETLQKAQAERQKKLDQDLILSSNEFFAGVKVGYDRMLQDQMTWAKSGEAIFKSFASNSKSTISNVLFDGIKGDLKSFEDYWDSFFDSLLRTFTDTVAEMATEQLASATVKGLSAVGGWAAGAAMDYLAEIDWFHSGAYMVGDALERSKNRMSSEDVLAVLQKGEMVIPKDVAEQIRGMLSGGSGGSSDPFGGGGVAGTIAGVIGGAQAGPGLSPGVGGRLASSYAGTATMAAVQGALTGKVSIGPMSIIGPLTHALSEQLQENYGIETGSGRYSSLASIVGVVVSALTNPALGLLAHLGVDVYGNYSYTQQKAEILAMNPAIEAAMAAANALTGGFDLGFDSPAGFDVVGDIGPDGSSGEGFGGEGPGGSDVSGGSDADAGFFRYGGLARGPESGYSARLHGTELVVSQKRDIPVKMSGGGRPSIGVIKIYLDGQEVSGRVKVIADGVVVERNKRGVNSTTRVYQ